MAQLPILSAKKLIKLLEKLEFKIVRQRGSHVRLKHQDGRVVTVSDHSGEDISRGLLRKILRDADISNEALLKLLE